MASISPLLSLLTLLSLLLLTQSRLYLNHSDFEVLSIIQKNLGIKGQYLSSANPCNNKSVFCEKKLTERRTNVLRVTRLVFGSQQLTGFISPEIGRLTELKEISLSNNYLIDKLPAQIIDCKKLEIIDLNNNQFSGEIPTDLFSLVRLRVLNLSSNRFSGNLSFLKHFPNLENLSVANNQFSGKIPASIRSFRNLQSFDFSGNSFLEGPVPLMNQIQPPVSSNPKRYILVENSTSTRKTITFAPGPAPAGAPTSTPTGAPKAHIKHKNKKVAGWFLGFFAGAVAGVISGFVFSILCKLVLGAIRGGSKDSGPSIYSPLIKKSDLAFLEKEDGVASLQIIGKGGCGEVYKTELPGSNGKMMAIKKINRPQNNAAELTDEESIFLSKKMRQVKSEINTVGHIRHKNLLPLLAHIPRPDCHYLVYEFMKNGSLEDVLREVSQGKAKLEWSVRHRIASGIAAALEYLHMNHSPRIIHRDLKPANILLDDDMEARIADFGLAQEVPDTYTHVTASNVAGTLGYIAPEYHQTLKFTDKCDIYSFGVVLAVLVVGKLPSDDFFQHTDELTLIKWMRNIITSENPSHAIDPKLMGEGYEEQMLLVLKIACFCTSEDPKQRPNSKEVRCMLDQIKR